MAEWLLEEGIGEDRAILLDGATIIAARLARHSDLRPGQVADVKLVSRPAGSTRGLVEFDNKERTLVSRLARDASEGATIRVEVTRATITEARRSKLAQARLIDKPLTAGASLADTLRNAGHDVRVVRHFPECDWDELLGEAFDQQVAFHGGMLFFSATPAMTLIDIDTGMNPLQGALAAVPAAAASLRRFNLGGSIGIDFPTLSAKADRRVVDDALADALADWPHERTAMNGFGFVQIVARLERPSLLHRILYDRLEAAAFQLLRHAELLEGPGRLLLQVNPALEPELRREWLDELRRRTGRELVIAALENVALFSPHAQIVPR